MILDVLCFIKGLWEHSGFSLLLFVLVPSSLSQCVQPCESLNVLFMFFKGYKNIDCGHSFFYDISDFIMTVKRELT